MKILLENIWSKNPEPNGTLQIKVTNLGEDALHDFTLCVTSITRVLKTSELRHARLVRRLANFHEFASLEPLHLNQGESWSFEITGISRLPLHHNEAVKTAWIATNDGNYLHVDVLPLIRADGDVGRIPERLPEGRLETPISLIPWPNEIEIETGNAPLYLCPNSGSTAADVQLMMEIGTLQSRLFPTSKNVFGFSEVGAVRMVKFVHDHVLTEESYRIEFLDFITIYSASKLGKLRALTTLAQMMHGAHNAHGFAFPVSGIISDGPRYDWRGSHLDCCRHFWTCDEVTRFVDILAWYKLNIFHWHFTDDEAWRAEIKAYPQLTAIGSARKMSVQSMLPQLGDGYDSEPRFYTQDDMRGVVAHAERLGIEVIPEIETPGHASAVCASLPQLVDPDEEPNSYYPIQGYPNNAWNPGVPETFNVLATIIEEMAAIFPSKYIHIGGDEVAPNAWMRSPLALALMEKEGLKDTFELQSWFGARMKAILDQHEKTLVGWNELSFGGGIARENTLLMAWETAEVGAKLAEEGYDVIMTPGQAYYLDMAQSDAWFENGAGWAGSTSPRKTYEYEADSGFPEALRQRLRGIQSCIWCEHYTSREWFNDLVFPRLLAISEAGWTQKQHKDFQRFAAQAKFHPSL